jgi:hypothetical protein
VHARQDLRRQDRVAAERKEVVVYTNVANAEQLRPDLAQQALGATARRSRRLEHRDTGPL